MKNKFYLFTGIIIGILLCASIGANDQTAPRYVYEFYLKHGSGRGGKGECIQAEFLGYNRSDVFLRNINGEEQKIPMSIFWPGSQKLIRYILQGPSAFRFTSDSIVGVIKDNPQPVVQDAQAPILQNENQRIDILEQKVQELEKKLGSLASEISGHRNNWTHHSHDGSISFQ